MKTCTVMSVNHPTSFFLSFKMICFQKMFLKYFLKLVTRPFFPLKSCFLFCVLRWSVFRKCFWNSFWNLLPDLFFPLNLVFFFLFSKTEGSSHCHHQMACSDQFWSDQIGSLLISTFFIFSWCIQKKQGAWLC